MRIPLDSIATLGHLSSGWASSLKRVSLRAPLPQRDHAVCVGWRSDPVRDQLPGRHVGHRRATRAGHCSSERLRSRRGTLRPCRLHPWRGSRRPVGTRAGELLARVSRTNVDRAARELAGPVRHGDCGAPHFWPSCDRRATTTALSRNRDMRWSTTLAYWLRQDDHRPRTHDGPYFSYV